MGNKLNDLQDRADEGKGGVIAGIGTCVSALLTIGGFALKLYNAWNGKQTRIGELQSENRHLETQYWGLGRIVNNSKIKVNNNEIDKLRK